MTQFGQSLKKKSETLSEKRVPTLDLIDALNNAKEIATGNFTSFNPSTIKLAKDIANLCEQEPGFDDPHKDIITEVKELADQIMLRLTDQPQLTAEEIVTKLEKVIRSREANIQI